MGSAACITGMRKINAEALQGMNEYALTLNNDL
jgi:hypothetical protein